MTVRACADVSVELTPGGIWDITVAVRDADGCLVDQTPVVTVTLPAGSTATPAVERLALGTYRATYEVATVGRYVARAVAAGYGSADFAAFVTAAVTATGMPDIADVDDYLGSHSHTDGELQDALDAEAAAQRRVCVVPAAYPPDLRQALLRRVARNLAMRRQKLGLILPGDEGSDGTSFIPRLDSEVRRFEAPHRKLAGG